MGQNGLRRTRHVVTEDQRILDAAAALHRGDAGQFGQLLAQSHLSLRNDYEVSSPGLDTRVDIAAHTPMSSARGSPARIRLMRHRARYHRPRPPRRMTITERYRELTTATR